MQIAEISFAPPLVALSSGQLWSGLAFLLTGIALAWFGLVVWKSWKDQQTWPETDGTIVESRVEVVNQDGDPTDVARMAHSYQVSGNVYRSNSLGGTAMVTARGLVTRLQVGRSSPFITIHR